MGSRRCRRDGIRKLRVSDFLFLAANTVPYWTRGAVVLLAAVVIGIVLYLVVEK